MKREQIITFKNEDELRFWLIHCSHRFTWDYTKIDNFEYAVIANRI
jgi:hypothetical protein